MATRTARKPAPKIRRISIALSEQMPQGKCRVDAAAGIIYDVKICGHDSANNRRYLPEALQGALPLYEGCFVNIDHPDGKASASRSARDRSAWLENVRYVGNDGIRGDLHFLLPLDETQKHVIWAAENKPNAFGLSHNAQGEGHVDANGVEIIRLIDSVRSVDIVADPATCNGLLESRTMKKPAKLDKATLKKILLEMGYAEEPDDETGGADHVDHLGAAILSIMQQVKDGTMDPDEGKKKILAAYKMAQPEAAMDEEEDVDDAKPSDKSKKPADVEEDDEDPDKKKKDDDDKKESVLKIKSKDPAVRELQEAYAAERRRNQRMQLREWIRQQLEAKKIPADKPLIESLLTMRDKDAIAKHMDYLKALAIKAKASAPRSEGPGQRNGHVATLTESASAKDFAKFLKRS